MRTLAIVSLVSLLLVTGCGGPMPEPEVDLWTDVDSEEESAPEILEEAPAVLPAESKVPERPPYRIGIGDRLLVKFFYYSGYDIEVTVRTDGMVTIPSLGEVKAEGMTPVELQRLIRSHYAQIIAEPDVSVIVAESASEQIFVFGEVPHPGAISYASSRTILDAIAQAGGIQDRGKKNSIILIRKAADGTFAGSKVDLERILDGNGANVELLPRDVVYVPVSTIGKVDLFVSQFFTQISPVLYFYIAGSDIFDPEGRYFIGR